MIRGTPKNWPEIFLKPIVKGNRLANLNEQEEESYLFRNKFDKMLQLANHYGGDLEKSADDWKLWAVVALRLAEDSLPGFQVVQTDRDLPRKKGRPRHSGGIDRGALRRVINQMLADSTAMGIADACRKLSKPTANTTKAFKGHRPESLETAFHKAVKELSDLQKQLNAMSPG